MEGINERIKALIDELKVSNYAFAKKINKSSTAINMIVKGDTKPGYEILEAIVEKFNVNPTWLLTGSETMFGSDHKPTELPVDKDYLSDHLEKLEEYFESLMAQQKHLLVQLDTKDQQLQTKDEQIEHLHEMLKMALGKSEGVSIEPVCEAESKAKKGARTPFFMPFKHKFGYTPSALMVAGSF